jgi:hypothetical protein
MRERTKVVEVELNGRVASSTSLIPARAQIKAVVEAHHGTVWAESEAGRGTQFTIRLGA